MNINDPLLEVYIYETQQLLESLEDVFLQGEKERCLTQDQINEIFRIMHTIKGSSAMMSFEKLAHVSHRLEDLFSQIRDKGTRGSDWGKIFDIGLAANDFIKCEVTKIQSGQEPDGEAVELLGTIQDYFDLLSNRKDAIKPEEKSETATFSGGEDFVDDLSTLAPYYKIKVNFEQDCKMEHVRAFGLAANLDKISYKLAHIPDDLADESSIEPIVKDGFLVYLQSGENPDSIKKIITSTIFMENFSLIHLEDDSEEIPEKIRPQKAVTVERRKTPRPPAMDAVSRQNFISVNVNKLDNLLNLVGEIVTTESMVTKNPVIMDMQLESFDRAAQQLRKLTNELQDVVMSIRMIPVSTTFHKMQRLVRDMSKKISKDVELVIIGEETEVDKNIIDNLSDPLMHIIRNAIDHGIESKEERRKSIKDPMGRVTLEARNTGGDVMIIISDDGKGLNKDAIINKALEMELIAKTDTEMSDKEAFSLIFLPGFSTKAQVTEFSGRGVGMDVVHKSIDKIGGTLSVESAEGKGTSFVIRIPLTLAIVEGMRLQVSDLNFIVPMLSIRESFKPNMSDVFLDPEGNEMIMIRGDCYSILRLHQLFGIKPMYENLEEGLLIMLEADDNVFCIFVDHLIGEQQAVVKPLPTYIQNHNVNIRGIGGCAILGDGTISLILDINNLEPV